MVWVLLVVSVLMLLCSAFVLLVETSVLEFPILVNSLPIRPSVLMFLKTGLTW